MNYIENYLRKIPNGLAELKSFFHKFPELTILLKIVMIILIVIIINLIITLISKHLYKKIAEGKSYSQMFYQAIGLPLRVIFWLFGVWYIVSELAHYLNDDFKSLGSFAVKYLQTGLVIVVVWALYRFFDKIKHNVMTKRKRTDGGYNDFSTIQTIERVGTILVTILGILTIMGIFDIPMAGLLTVGGIGGAAIAFANQQLIANIFSGFAIFFDRPFSVGDWVYTSDQKVQGTVEKIGLRLTVIRGFDKRPIYVPNSMFNTAPMVNASRMTNRRIYQFIGLRYSDFSRIAQILIDIRLMLKAHDAIDQDMLTLINIVNGSTNMGSSTEGFFGNSSINFMIYTFTKTTNWVEFQNIQDDVMIKVGQIILDNGAEVAFTTTTLDFQSEQALNIEIQAGK